MVVHEKSIYRKDRLREMEKGWGQCAGVQCAAREHKKAKSLPQKWKEVWCVWKAVYEEEGGRKEGRGGQAWPFPVCVGEGEGRDLGLP